jgi:hypothetical protein
LLAIWTGKPARTTGCDEGIGGVELLLRGRRDEKHGGGLEEVSDTAAPGHGKKTTLPRIPMLAGVVASALLAKRMYMLLVGETMVLLAGMTAVPASL